MSALLLLLVWGTGDCRAQGSTPAEPITVRIGGVTLRPGGFLDIIGESRTADTPDSISTNFGDIPLEATHGQSFGSLRNSRLQLRGDWGGEGLHFTGYLESDFLNFTPGESDYRWRQYWLRARFHGWEILGGQAWSLLRPNRKGFDSDRDLMNTDVIDAGYHVGLLGSRRRQVRLGRTFGDYRAVFAWETQGNFLAKVTADKGFGHVEAVAFTGHRGRRGVTIAAVLNVTSRLHFVTQEYWSKRAAFEALGVVPMGPNGAAAIQGLEFQAARHLEVYSYGGLVYASHTSGNRLVREWTVGFDQRRAVPAIRGELLVSGQYSQMDRFLWTGRSGAMNMAMYRLRYTFN